MQDALALLALEAAYDLSDAAGAAMQRIANVAAKAMPHGPVMVGYFDTNAQLDPCSLHFEQADDSYVSRFFEWQQTAPTAIRRLALSLTPQLIDFDSETCGYLPDQLQIISREVFRLCVVANTGDGSGLQIAFGHQGVIAYPAAQLRQFDAIAQHLAAAWRMRTSLTHGDRAPAVAAELRVDGTPMGVHPDASTPTAREALRQAVLARERARSGRRSAETQALWPALIAGRWTLLDAFTASGTRYVVAYENPPGTDELRALDPRQRVVLELALEGRSGKWIAVELQMSESTVTRTLHTALRRVGAADIAGLAGMQTAVFEALDGVTAGRDLAIARSTPAEPSLVSLSEAERAIVDSLLSGKRIGAIARERGTSPRTVGHQIASVYRKLDISSRRELLTRLA